MTDVDALNRDFAKYDQVEKAHTYRLAEHESDEFEDEYEIATLDIDPFLRGDVADKARFAEAFGVAQDRTDAFRAEDYWPRAEYEQQFRRLVHSHEPLFKPIAQAMLQGLGCDPHLLDAKLTGTNFGLRLNYYPPITEEQDRSG